jgi:hypothetical protein
MLGGVFIRTGSVIAASGVRVVSGLVQRLGSLSFINDNAGCLGGQPFPRDGWIMSFGFHEVYVGTERICRRERSWWRRIRRHIGWLTLGVALAQ